MKLILQVAFLLVAGPVLAGESWDAIREDLYGARPLIAAEQMITIDAPYRSENDARTMIAADVRVPGGRMIDEVTVVLDENPMPVSAVFSLKQPQPRFVFRAAMRVNGPTPVHVVARTTDNQLYVAETFVKTSGLGACSAPPGTDEEIALATLGNMEIDFVGSDTGTGGVLSQVAAIVHDQREIDVNISHPSHSGMQMDQISLLFIPMRYVSDVDIGINGQPFVDITGSISLSENPELRLSVPGDATRVDVEMTDTDGTVSRASKSLRLY